MTYFDSLQEEIHSLFCVKTVKLPMLAARASQSAWFLGIPSRASAVAALPSIIGFPRDQLVVQSLIEAPEPYSALEGLVRTMLADNWKCVAQVYVTPDKLEATLVGRAAIGEPYAGRVLEYCRSEDSGWTLISVRQAGPQVQLLV